MLYIFQTQRLTTPVHSSLFTLPHSLPSLSHYTLHRSLRSRCLSLPHPFPSFSLTHFDQTPLPVLWSLPDPFRTLTVPAAVDYRYVALPFYYFMLHLFCGKWMIIKGGSRITKIFNFFSICFVGMTQVQVLCKEENMIISASYIFYYLKMCC